MTERTRDEPSLAKNTSQTQTRFGPIAQSRVGPKHVSVKLLAARLLGCHMLPAEPT